MQTRPAAKLYYTVAGRTVLIDAYDDWSNLAVSKLFAGWFLTPIPSDGVSRVDSTISVRCSVPLRSIPNGLSSFEITYGGICHTDHQHYYLDFDGSLVFFDHGPDVELWVREPYEPTSPHVVQLLSHALSPALRRCRVFELHSAGVVPIDGQKAVMIAGPSGSGKSTLTSLLARSGWSYLSDDILLLSERNRGLEAQAFRRFFALTANTVQVANLELKATGNVFKERVLPEDHFGANQIQSAVPGSILFSSISGEGQSRFSPLSATEAMTRLLRLCPWASYDKATSIDHLRLLGQLANSVASFELQAGRDLVTDPLMAGRLVSNLIDETETSHVG